MKPENILLRKSNKSGIKVIDFGSGTYEQEQFYTYIQSRFYRAPEIMMGIKYTPAIDMWSLGCILYELFVGFPIFAGEDEKEQMQCIMEVKGVPPRSMIVIASRRKVFFDDDYRPLQQPNSKGKLRHINSKNLSHMMQADENQGDFVDFINHCLEWKPDKRMTPEDAFRHPWIKAGIKELKQKMEQAPQQTQQTAGSQQSQEASRWNSQTRDSTHANNQKSSGLPTINDSQQSRTTNAVENQSHPSQSSNKQLSQNPKSPQTHKKLIISED